MLVSADTFAPAYGWPVSIRRPLIWFGSELLKAGAFPPALDPLLAAQSVPVGSQKSSNVFRTPVA